jgi:hypothetical protein
VDQCPDFLLEFGSCVVLVFLLFDFLTDAISFSVNDILDEIS